MSDMARNHFDIRQQKMNEIPKLVWATYHVVHELYAGAANIEAVRDMCRERKLANYELAELIEYDSLADVSPGETRLDSVIVNLKEREVEFTYRVGVSYEVEKGIIFLTIIVFFVILLLISIVTANVRIVKALRATHVHNTIELTSRYSADI